jgi:hypothetical protein
MDWLSDSCGAVTDFSLLIGAFSGLIIDVTILIAIVQTPALREHGGAVAPESFAERRLLPLPPILVALLWFGGCIYAGAELLPCYAIWSVMAAAVIVGALMLILFPIAASQIARRSVW